jgi:hypothetical protein
MPSSDQLQPITSGELERVHGAFPHMRSQTAVSKSLRQYYRDVSVPLPFDRSSARFDGLRAGLSHTLGEVLARPAEACDKLLTAFEKAFLASSAEHQSSISHPESMNVVFNQALYRQEHGHDCLVALACGTVKLDNEVFSRGMLVRQDKVPFLPASHQNQMTLVAPPLRRDFFEKNLLEALAGAADGGRLRDMAMAWWSQAASELASMDRLWKQLSMMNASLWRHCGAALRPPVGDYYMLPIERLVAEALAHDLEHGRRGWLHRALLESPARTYLHEALSGVRSCWDHREGWGTFLFWSVDKKGRPVNLQLSGTRLVSKAGDVEVELAPGPLIEALRGERLIPASNLCFLYMSLYLGMSLFGGILQVNYLPEMQRRLLESGREYLSSEEYDVLAEVKTGLYVNFETRSITAGGLLSLLEPPPPEVWEEYGQRGFVDEMQGCLRFLHSLT